MVKIAIINRVHPRPSSFSNACKSGTSGTNPVGLKGKEKNYNTVKAKDGQNGDNGFKHGLEAHFSTLIIDHRSRLLSHRTKLMVIINRVHA